MQSRAVARSKHTISGSIARRGHSPAALKLRGIGTPRWQLNETLIPESAARYYYVNPGRLVCDAAQKWHPTAAANGEKNRPSRKPRFLIGAERPGPQCHGHRKALGVGRASVCRSGAMAAGSPCYFSLRDNSPRPGSLSSMPSKPPSCQLQPDQNEPDLWDRFPSCAKAIF
jgi:hypothetical protein